MTIRKLISYFLIGLILMLIGSIVKSGIKSLSAEERLTDLQTKVENLTKQQQVLTGGAEKYASVEFVEQQIRNKLKLVKPGEKVIVLPAELSEKNEEAQYSYKEAEVELLPETVIWKSWIQLFL